MKKLAKVFLFFSLCFGLCGCSGGEKVSDYERIHSRLSEMTGYKAVCQVTYYGNNMENTYTVNQTAESGGKYKIEAVKPKDLAGTSILFDGNLIWLYNPSIDSKIQASSSEGDSRREIILFTFLKNESLSGEETSVSAVSAQGEKYVVLEASIPGGKTSYNREELFVDIKSGNPSRLVIYDENDNEHIRAEFTEFEYNPEISADEFKIVSELMTNSENR
ncbi:MAG: outer-membrane lipoprotein carrier protein LolA [Clostridiales bacterium]|nr:outer-membrane lipoprotein carrier protein LolA [Clostridiales bacterium]